MLLASLVSDQTEFRELLAFSNALDTPLSGGERPIRSASCEADLENLLSISVILSFELILIHIEAKFIAEGVKTTWAWQKEKSNFEASVHDIFIVFLTCLRFTKGSFNIKSCRHFPHFSCKPAEGIVRLFGIETLNTFVHSRGSLESHDRFQTKMSKVHTCFQTKTVQNPYLYVNRFLYRLNCIFCPITYLLVFRQLARKWLK